MKTKQAIIWLVLVLAVSIFQVNGQANSQANEHKNLFMVQVEAGQVQKVCQELGWARITIFDIEGDWLLIHLNPKSRLIPFTREWTGIRDVFKDPDTARMKAKSAPTSIKNQFSYLWTKLGKSNNNANPPADTPNLAQRNLSGWRSEQMIWSLMKKALNNPTSFRRTSTRAMVSATTGAISGTIFDENNCGISGVTVYATEIIKNEIWEPAIKGECITRSTGQYLMDNLPAGYYWIRIESNGKNYHGAFYSDISYGDYIDVQVFGLEEGLKYPNDVPVIVGCETTGIDQKLVAGNSVSGRLINTVGVGVPNAWIYTEQGSIGSYGWASVSVPTDADGYFELAGVADFNIPYDGNCGYNGIDNGCGYYVRANAPTYIELMSDKLWGTQTNVILEMEKETDPEYYTELKINSSYKTEGHISPLGNSDWFNFKVTKAGLYEIETWIGTCSDTVMYLYGPDDPFYLLNSNDDKDPGKDFGSRIITYLYSGDYRVEIRGWNDLHEGTYWINVKNRMSLTLTAPNGGNNLLLGNTYTVTWTGSDLNSGVRLYLEDVYANEYLIGDLLNGTSLKYPWKVGLSNGNLYSTGSYYVIIRSITDPSTYDYSNAPINITGTPKLKVLFPNTAVKLLNGSNQTIRWESYGLLGDITIFLYKGLTKLGIIADNISLTDRSYDWKVGAALAGGTTYLPGIGYRIKLQSKLKTTIIDYSDAKFTIIK